MRNNRNRVKSRKDSREGTVMHETAGVYQIRWDDGELAFLHASAFIKLDEHSLAEVHA